MIYRYDPQLTFSYSATGVALPPVQEALLAGDASRPLSQTLFFDGRGAGEFELSHIVDAAFNVRLLVSRDLVPSVTFEVIQSLRHQPLIGFNTAVTPDPNSPHDALGLPTGFVEGPRLGEAEEVEDFPLARTFRVALGFRV